jgi:hypothetical protein
MTFQDQQVIPIVALVILGGGLFLLIRKAMKVETHIIDEEGIQIAWRQDIAEARVVMNHLSAHGIDAHAVAGPWGRGLHGGVGIFVQPANVAAAAKLLEVQPHPDRSGAV